MSYRKMIHEIKYNVLYETFNNILFQLNWKKASKTYPNRQFEEALIRWIRSDFVEFMIAYPKNRFLWEFLFVFPNFSSIKRKDLRRGQATFGIYCCLNFFALTHKSQWFVMKCLIHLIQKLMPRCIRSEFEKYHFRNMNVLYVLCIFMANHFFESFDWTDTFRLNYIICISTIEPASYNLKDKECKIK